MNKVEWDKERIKTEYAWNRLGYEPKADAHPCYVWDDANSKPKTLYFDLDGVEATIKSSEELKALRERRLRAYIELLGKKKI